MLTYLQRISGFKESSTRTLAGFLEMTCSRGEMGKSILSHQSFQAPYHISKPYWDDPVLVVQVINPTAGLFAGDTLSLRIVVEAGAVFRVSSPSACRLFTMPEGTAMVDQSYHVASGAWLEAAPALLIPQKGSACRWTTRIQVERGGELFYFETLAPGRVAFGEWFQFRELDWEMDLVWNDRLVARERFCLRPEDASLAGLRCGVDHAYFGSGYLITERLVETDSIWDEIRQLETPGVVLGIQTLLAGGWGFKMLARDNLLLTKTVGALRRLLSRQLPALQSTNRYR